MTHKLPNSLTTNRRHFITTASALTAAPVVCSSPNRTLAATSSIQDDASLKNRIFKTLKIDMIKVEGDLITKFEAAKQAGFKGVELNSPGVDIDSTKKAIETTGVQVDGTVCSTHWQTRHTSPKADVRKQARRDLEVAIRDTKAVGGHTVLLVIGHGQDGPADEIWPRAVDSISQLIPLCAELGITIAIENVWNKMLYDHDGSSDQSADQFVKFVDAFHSPWVKMQFDIGNHWKYGNMGDWIRSLGNRIVKLDLKGFSRKQNKFTPIGGGDVDWADVRKALFEINFHGWAAAEVGGGGQKRLNQISANLDRVLNLS